MDVDLNSPNVVIAAESVASQLVFVAADSELFRQNHFMMHVCDVVGSCGRYALI